MLKIIEKLKPRKRYEVMVLMTHINYNDEKLDKVAKAQNEGWEICGDILLKNEDGWCGNTYIHIPMKRKI
jgi:hypothetical protein